MDGQTTSDVGPGAGLADGQTTSDEGAGARHPATWEQEPESVWQTADPLSLLLDVQRIRHHHVNRLLIKKSSFDIFNLHRGLVSFPLQVQR